MDADRFFTRLNPVILWLLGSPLHAVASGQLMSLSYTGRRSGRRITLPVGYQRTADRIDVLVSKAPRKQWWRNFREPAAVELRVRGRRLRGLARLVDPSEPAFRQTCEHTFDRVPMLPRQFGLTDHRRGQPLTDEQLSVVAAQGRLVRIDLDGSAAPP